MKKLLKLLCYKIQNIQVVQILDKSFTLRKGWIFYRFADFKDIDFTGKWHWRTYEGSWFKDCVLSSKEEVMKYIKIYFNSNKYTIFPVEVNEIIKIILENK